MGTQQSDGLNWDEDGRFTMGEFGDAGDATNKWILWVRGKDGALVQLGTMAAAAVTDPAASASVIAALKGVLSRLNIGPNGLLKAEDGGAASGDAGVMALAIRRDTPTSDAANGDYHALHVDSAGRLRVTTAADLSNSDSTALEASRVIKASAGTIYKLRIVNTAGAAQYVHLFNTAAVPADATVPTVVGYVAAGGVLELDFTQFGRRFTTGIAVSNSSTPAAKTIGSADCLFSAQYL